MPFFNVLILEEYRNVLSRKKFAFSSLQVSCLIEGIIRLGIAVENEPPGNVAMIDKDDRIFYDTAKKVPAYLITGNIRHFPKESFIVTPTQFLTAFFC
jgi:predicted nucleic acid-binding protein